MVKSAHTNFAILQQHDEQLLRLGMLAEKYFADDPNTCLLKLRQLAELLAQMLAARIGLYTSSEENQFDLLRRLQDNGVLPREIFQLFNEIRRAGNAANHAMSGDHRSALSTLKLAWQLGLWFHRSFKDPSHKSGPFLPPIPPADESNELRIELERLHKAVNDYQAAQQDVAQQLQSTQSQLREAKDERLFWEQLATETEQAKAALAQRLTEQQSLATSQPKNTVSQFITAANLAADALQLDETDTRKLIDQQLRQAGWEADSEIITFKKGSRPEKTAIAPLRNGLQRAARRITSCSSA
ncbi:DUF4145 domain-containing protein [Methylocucumis oryzae]|uniref:DUF4145 domain-containing protein n=1 Tax=Methylocucumis oryzae TaxID=1632867 RepID=UPI000A5FDF5F|nr:DUF4145 domain-containing protein [Methylocucumis oryzae]